MKKTGLGLIASIMLLPVLSWAQAAPQAPASWIAFQQQERVKKIAFFQELKNDRDQFLSEHPEVKSYLEEVRASNKARMAAWRASHPRS